MDLDKAIIYAINKYKTISDFACKTEGITMDDYLHRWYKYSNDQQGLISATIVHTLCMMVYEEMKLEEADNIDG